MIKRYDIAILERDCTETYFGYTEDEHGDWCKYKDAAREIKKLKLQIEFIKEQNR